MPPTLTVHVLRRLLVALSLAGSVAWLASCRRQDGKSAGQAEGPRLAAWLGKTIGNADAPIAVEALLPINNGCQDALGLYLADVATRYPHVLQVRIFDMRSAEGRALMASKGIKCAAVIVQGVTRFDLGEEYGKVLLEGPMDPLDVYHVLQFQVRTCMAAGVDFPVPPETAVPPTEERRKAGF